MICLMLNCCVCFVGNGTLIGNGMVVGSDENVRRTDTRNTIYFMYLVFLEMGQRHSVFGYRCFGNVAVLKLPILEEWTPHPHCCVNLIFAIIFI
jgi:hypothetical protein